MRILYVQINNDFSGSSYALKAIIDSHEIGEKVLMTSFSSKGFLTENTTAKTINIPYQFKGKSIFTINNLLRNWIKGTKAFLRLHRKTPIDIVYLNAISPWHISLPAKLLGVKVIYHVHEVYNKPNALIKLYLYMMARTADKLIFVSKDCKARYKQTISFRKIPNTIQYTPIRYKTIKSDEIDIRRKFGGAIIMICSPKRYKGVEKFLEIATIRTDRKFKLFMSGKYNFHVEIPPNMEVIVGKNHLIEDLRNASILLSLTRYSDIIETFGLTIWEAMSQGTPVIAPNVGGPTELVTTQSGACIDVEDAGQIISAIESLTINMKVYQAFSNGAIKQSEKLFNKYPITIPC